VSTEVIMPALGMSQDTGRLVAWLKGEGASVVKGDLIMEIETDKATVEIEAEADGTLANFRAQAGDEVPVGEVIALILEAGETAPPQQQADSIDTPVTPPATISSDGQNKSPTPVAIRVAAAHDIDLSVVPSSGKRVTRTDVEAYLEAQSAQSIQANPIRILASPKARRLAQERQLNLAELDGSGPEGAVLAKDVLNYSPTTPPSAATLNTDEIQTGQMWRRMAERLTASWQTIPHFYLKRDVDASNFVAWRQELKTRSEIKITFTDLLVKVVAAALRQHPYVNSCWNGEGVVFNEQINIGLAVAVEQGLLVPVIHNAEHLGVTEIAERRAQIVHRALQNKLYLKDLQGGTFTMSNLGMYGIDQFDAIVNPPQVAILAVGSITEKVIPADGDIIVQPSLTLSLSCDHRAVDGARGARFLQTLAAYIAEPLRLMD